MVYNMLDFLGNKKLYESILNGKNPDKIIRSLAYGYPITETVKIGNESISDIKVGNNNLNKIAIGSTIVYDSSAQ